MFVACFWTHLFTNSRHSYHCPDMGSLNISSTTILSSAPGHGRLALPSVIRYTLPCLLLAKLAVQSDIVNSDGGPTTNALLKLLALAQTICESSSPPFCILRRNLSTFTKANFYAKQGDRDATGKPPVSIQVPFYVYMTCAIMVMLMIFRQNAWEVL